MMINVQGRQLPCNIATRRSDPEWGGRESKAITVAMTYDEAVETFVDDVDWSVSSEITSLDGKVYTETIDMSAYAISGPITDNRDGTVTVRMGKYRDEELLQTALEAMLPYLTEQYGNPSSLYSFGQKAQEALDRKIGQLLERK